MREGSGRHETAWCVILNHGSDSVHHRKSRRGLSARSGGIEGRRSAYLEPLHSRDYSCDFCKTVEEWDSASSVTSLVPREGSEALLHKALRTLGNAKNTRIKLSMARD